MKTLSAPSRLAAPRRPTLARPQSVRPRPYLPPLPACALSRQRRTCRPSQRQPLWTAASAPSAAQLSAGVPDDNPVFTERFVRVVFPLALALLLCNMDRIVMSVAILPMSAEFGWAPGMQGLVQSAFLWGYMITPILGGALADKYGGKIVMSWGIAWFSLSSMLLPAAFSAKVAAAGLTLPAVLAARAMVGLGEGVALPSMNNLVATNVPPARRATALGTAFSGFHSGNLLGLVLSPLLLHAFGWRSLFLIFGVLGGPLLLMWNLCVPSVPRPDPEPITAGSAAFQRPAGGAYRPVPSALLLPMSATLACNPHSTASASQPGASVGVRQLLSSPATWAIIIVNIVNHWGYFIYLSFIPTYFYQVLKLDLKSSAFLSLLPWTVMAVGSSAAGWLADALVARGLSVTKVRKRLQTVAFLVPAAALTVLVNPSISSAMAVACMTLALGVSSLGQAGFVANMSDIAPRQSGKLFGICNTFGTAAGIAGVAGAGYVVQLSGSFVPVFQLTAVLYVVATIAWNLMCTGEQVFS